MKNYINISLIAISVMFFATSCRTKKSVTKSETIKIDSDYINRSEVVFTPLASTLTINDLCDTITGKPRPFKSEIARGKDNVFIEVAGNSLKLNIDLDSLVSSEVRKERSKWESEKTEKTTTKYRVSKWAWWTMGIQLGIIVLFVAFPGIPRWLRGIISL